MNIALSLASLALLFDGTTKGRSPLVYYISIRKGRRPFLIILYEVKNKYDFWAGGPKDLFILDYWAEPNNRVCSTHEGLRPSLVCPTHNKWAEPTYCWILHSSWAGGPTSVQYPRLVGRRPTNRVLYTHDWPEANH